jgi:DNA-binding CsgD family transcriptional regulator
MPTSKKRISDRELREAICDGKPLRAIAEFHGVSVRTIDSRLESIRKRTGAKNMAELVAKWFRQGLIQ